MVGRLLVGVQLALACLVGCGSDAPGAANGGTAGSSAGGAMSNTSGAAGASAGTNSATSGTAGAPSAGQAGQQTTSAGSGGNAGASGSEGAGGSSGASAGDGGSGGSGALALPKRVLLYHFSTLVIDSVPAQLTLLKSQLQTWGYESEDSVNPDDLSSANLARFGAVGMINTCFEPFGAGKMGETQTSALEAFVESGGGLFGTHCAAVTFQAAEPPHPYNGVIGGRGGHGFFDGKSACRTLGTHVTNQMLPATFDFTGNLDNADYVAADSQVLVKCKWSGGDMKDTPVSWLRTPGKGRVFYTNFAKVDADLSDAMLGQKHILLGLSWVLGR